MNVWIRFMFWSGAYPTGPDDVRCGSSISRSPPRAPAEYIEPSLTTDHEAWSSIQNENKETVNDYMKLK